jgi:hypothetical protein
VIGAGRIITGSAAEGVRGVEAMTYFGPDGSIVVDPSAELLERLVFRERGGLWRVGSGDASLSVAVHTRHKTYASVAGQPTLMFFLVPRHGFFFTYFEPQPVGVVQWVPFAGGECRPWVEHCIGGDCFFAPRACFVSRPFAWAVVSEFVRSRRRSPAVPWVERSGLEFPFPPAGDPRPRKADLA